MSIHKIQEADALLLYKVGPVHVCSPTMQVEAVVLPPKFSVPPGSNESEPGMFRSIHGMVRVIDLRVRFGVEEDDRKDPGRIIIVEIEGGHAGFWVDEIEDVVSFPTTGWAGVPPHIPRQVFSRTLTQKDHIRLYADFDQLDKFKAHGYLRKHIQQIKQAQIRKTDIGEELGKHTSIYDSGKTSKTQSRTGESEAARKIGDANKTVAENKPQDLREVVGDNEKVSRTNLPGGESISERSARPDIHHVQSSVEKKSDSLKHVATKITSVKKASGDEMPELRSVHAGGISDSRRDTADKAESEPKRNRSKLSGKSVPAKNDINSKAKHVAADGFKGSISKEGLNSSVIQSNYSSNRERNVDASVNRSQVSRKLSAVQSEILNTNSNNSSGFVWLAISLVLLLGLALIGYEYFAAMPEVQVRSDKPKPMMLKPDDVVSGDEYGEPDEVREINESGELDESGYTSYVENDFASDKNEGIDTGSGKVEITKLEKDILIVVHEYEDMQTADNMNAMPDEVENVIDVPAEEYSVEENISDEMTDRSIVNNVYPLEDQTKAYDLSREAGSNESLSESLAVQEANNEYIELQRGADQSNDVLPDEFVESEPEKTGHVVEEGEGVYVAEAEKSLLDEAETQVEGGIDKTRQPETKVLQAVTSKKNDIKLIKGPESSTIDSAEVSPKSQKHIHVVVKGDTLWHIAKRYVNNPWRYPELARLSKIRNPDLIYPGQKIIIILNFK